MLVILQNLEEKHVFLLNVFHGAALYLGRLTPNLLTRESSERWLFVLMIVLLLVSDAPTSCCHKDRAAGGV